MTILLQTVAKIFISTLMCIETIHLLTRVTKVGVLLNTAKDDKGFQIDVLNAAKNEKEFDNPNPNPSPNLTLMLTLI